MQYYLRLFSALVVALALSTGFVSAQRVDIAPRMTTPDLSVTTMPDLQAVTPLSTDRLAAPQLAAPQVDQSVQQPATAACNYTDTNGYYHRC
jgi:hypothetical protein